MSEQSLNPLTLPLQGLQVIEASAGTGKTYTLAALYVRLVLGHGRSQRGLTPPEILVMTFTEAATAELRDRIRVRLTQASQAFREDAFLTDAFLKDLKSDIDSSEWPRCAAQLDAAAQWMDEAAIYTIHGWSSRMLRQHAFDSSSLFEQSTVDDSQALRLQVAADYWREWYYGFDDTQIQAVLKIADTPTSLVNKLLPIWRVQERSLPENVQASTLNKNRLDNLPTPLKILEQWSLAKTHVHELQMQAQALWSAHGSDLIEQLRLAMENDLNGNSYKAALRDSYIEQLIAWMQGDGLDPKVAVKFTLRELCAKTKASRPKPEDSTGAFAAMQAWIDALNDTPSPQEALLAHAAQDIAQRYERIKQQRGQFDFSDLLTRLFSALQLPNSRLPQAIREQYPVALVDEFQDTDPWQWGALSKIYLHHHDAGVGLLLIGDPKQAIYSFRGADLKTYIAAREQAQAVHTLSINYRSTAKMIEAVNHVFTQAHQPFGVLDFNPALAPDSLKFKSHENIDAPAMTVWHLQSQNPLTTNDYLKQMSDICATQIVSLLQRGQAQPSELAILVRDSLEARAIREALQSREVRSVYLSDRESVFNTPEALDLWYVLQAISQPHSMQHLRAALSCRTLGLSAIEIEHLLQNESAWDEQVERFEQWQLTWQRQGFLPMIYRWMHEQQIAQRLTACTTNPERRLTNLLHLGDLLQKVSLNLQGQSALLRYLADQINDPMASGEAAQMRLETDANLVQVITMHKAKGLQFPCVFIPFASNFKKEKKDSLRSDDERIQEDKRLLYVALTRAERQLYLGVALRIRDFIAKSSQPASALSDLLGRKSALDLNERLLNWASCKAIQVVTAPQASDLKYSPATSATEFQPALIPSRQQHNPWWLASFSALTRVSAARPAWALPSEKEDRWQDSNTDSAQSLDWSITEPPLEVPTQATHTFNAFLAGSAYGTLLHDLLEWQLKEDWPIVRSDAPACAEKTTRWELVFQSQTAALQLDSAQCELLLDWLQHLATTPLPLANALGDLGVPDLTLSQLSPAKAWAEMNFTLHTHGLQAQALDDIITSYVLPGQIREPLQNRRLQGLLTGFMDVVFEHAGRYYVLDYKSNKLPAYDLTDLQPAILAHRYDVQLSLYVLALHRLLQARLPDYEPEQHMGGAVYLFARGVDQLGAGVFAYRPSADLLTELDDAFKANQ